MEQISSKTLRSPSEASSSSSSDREKAGWSGRGVTAISAVLQQVDAAPSKALADSCMKNLEHLLKNPMDDAGDFTRLITLVSQRQVQYISQEQWHRLGLLLSMRISKIAASTTPLRQETLTHLKSSAATIAEGILGTLPNAMPSQAVEHAARARIAMKLVTYFMEVNDCPEQLQRVHKFIIQRCIPSLQTSERNEDRTLAYQSLLRSMQALEPTEDSITHLTAIITSLAPPADQPFTPESLQVVTAAVSFCSNHGIAPERLFAGLWTTLLSRVESDDIFRQHAFKRFSELLTILTTGDYTFPQALTDHLLRAIAAMSAGDALNLVTFTKLLSPFYDAIGLYPDIGDLSKISPANRHLLHFLIPYLQWCVKEARMTQAFTCHLRAAIACLSDMAHQAPPLSLEQAAALSPIAEALIPTIARDLPFSRDDELTYALKGLVYFKCLLHPAIYAVMEKTLELSLSCGHPSVPIELIISTLASSLETGVPGRKLTLDLVAALFGILRQQHQYAHVEAIYRLVLSHCTEDINQEKRSLVKGLVKALDTRDKFYNPYVPPNPAMWQHAAECRKMCLQHVTTLLNSHQDDTDIFELAAYTLEACLAPYAVSPDRLLDNSNEEPWQHLSNLLIEMAPLLCHKREAMRGIIFQANAYAALDAAKGLPYGCHRPDDIQPATALYHNMINARGRYAMLAAAIILQTPDQADSRSEKDKGSLCIYSIAWGAFKRATESKLKQLAARGTSDIELAYEEIGLDMQWMLDACCYHVSPRGASELNVYLAPWFEYITKVIKLSTAPSANLSTEELIASLSDTLKATLDHIDLATSFKQQMARDWLVTLYGIQDTAKGNPGLSLTLTTAINSWKARTSDTDYATRRAEPKATKKVSPAKPATSSPRRNKGKGKGKAGRRRN